jgi:hypothetical protein
MCYRASCKDVVQITTDFNMSYKEQILKIQNVIYFNHSYEVERILYIQSFIWSWENIVHGKVKIKRESHGPKEILKNIKKIFTYKYIKNQNTNIEEEERDIKTKITALNTLLLFVVLSLFRRLSGHGRQLGLFWTLLYKIA